MTSEEAWLQMGLPASLGWIHPRSVIFPPHLRPIRRLVCASVFNLSQVIYDVIKIDYMSGKKPSRLVVSSSSSVIVAIYGFIRFIMFGDEANFMAL